MAEKIPQLVKIPPLRIIIREEETRPTHRDNRVVYSDMVKYVSTARVVGAVPEVKLQHKAIIAVNGVPFVLAATEANPPLETIVCACPCAPQQLRELGLQVVTATEILDELQASMPFEVMDMLFFVNPVEQSKQLEIQGFLAACFDQINEAMSERGANLLRSIEWQDGGSILIWKWPYMVLEGSHALMLPQMIHRIDSGIAKIRSWNGLALTHDTR